MDTNRTRAELIASRLQAEEYLISKGWKQVACTNCDGRGLKCFDGYNYDRCEVCGGEKLMWECQSFHQSNIDNLKQPLNQS